MALSFTPSTFDKAFKKAVELLLKEKIATQKNLAEEFTITPQALNAILKEERGVPISKRSYITYRLVDLYNVNKSFLETNRGSILTKPLTISEEEFPQYSTVKSELDMCRKEVELLRSQIRTNEQLLSVQQELIEQLKTRKN